MYNVIIPAVFFSLGIILNGLSFALLENKEDTGNADEKENKSMFPRPYKHKLCCLRPELIEGFIA